MSLLCNAAHLHLRDVEVLVVGQQADEGGTVRGAKRALFTGPCAMTAGKRNMVSRSMHQGSGNARKTVVGNKACRPFLVACCRTRLIFRSEYIRKLAERIQDMLNNAVTAFRGCQMNGYHLFGCAWRVINGR